MKIKTGTAIIFCIAFGVSACKQNWTKQEAKNIATEDQIEKKEEQKLDSVAPSVATGTFSSPQREDWDKKIIKTGTLTIQVKNYKSFDNGLNTIVKSNGGYIATEKESDIDDRIENKVTIKVPVGQFQNLMAALTNLNEKVLDKEITSDDVTTEVIDTKARIEAKKKIRQRYLALLQQAKSMEDILSVQNEIDTIQEQLEMAEGRSAYLSNVTAYSTIELTYFQISEGNENNYSNSFKEKLSTAFINGWKFIQTLLIIFITIWPLWIIGAIGFLFLKK